MKMVPYVVDPDSELGRLMDRAEDAPILLEKNGKRFRLVSEPEDVWADYDPVAALAGMDAAVGSISAEEAERIKKLVYEAREAGTRPLARP